MTQTIAKFLLIVFCYPFLPMRDPGTAYAPSVAAEEERKTSYSLLWCFVWYVSTVGLAYRYGGDETAAKTAYILFICFVMAVEWKTGLLIVALSLILVPWKVALGTLLIFALWGLTVGYLEYLAMDEWERGRVYGRGWKQHRSKALLDKVNQR